jgi:hypothetical protein
VSGRPEWVKTAKGSYRHPVNKAPGATGAIKALKCQPNNPIYVFATTDDSLPVCPRCIKFEEFEKEMDRGDWIPD